MKNVIKIFKSDVEKIRGNWVAMVILCGLIVLPCLYAWFNIYASWDPYGNMTGIKIGVVNLDSPAVLYGNEINAGQEVVDNLKENTDLGWVFYDSEEAALEDTDLGKTYATVVIPADFSAKLCTVFEPQPVRPVVEYYVNQRENAIAPKMTDKGSQAIQQEISDTFVETIVEKVFEKTNDLGESLDEDYHEIMLARELLEVTNGKMPTYESRIDKVKEYARENIDGIGEDITNLERVQEILYQSGGYAQELSFDLLDTNNYIQQISPDLIASLRDLTDFTYEADVLAKDLDLTYEDLEDFLDDSLGNLTKDVKNLESSLQEISSLTGSISSNLQKEVSGQIAQLQGALSSYKMALGQIRVLIGTGEAEDAASALEIAQGLVQQNQQVIAQLEALRTTLNTEVRNMVQALDTLEKLLKALDKLSKGDSLLEPSARLSSVPEMKALIDEEELEEDDTVGTCLTSLAEEFEEAAENPNLPAAVADSARMMGSLLREVKATDGSEEAVSALASGAGTAADLVEKLQKELQTQAKQLDALLSEALDGFKQLDVAFQALEGALRVLNAPGTPEAQKKAVIEQLDKQIPVMIAEIEKSEAKLKDAQQQIGQIGDASAPVTDLTNGVLGQVSDIKHALYKINDAYEEGNIEDTVESFRHMTKSLRRLTRRVTDDYETRFLTKADKILNNASDFSADMGWILTYMGDESGDLISTLDHVQEVGAWVLDDLDDLKERFPDWSEKLQDINDRLSDMEENISIKEMIRIMNNDVQTEKEFFSSPVELRTTELHSMYLYGAGMTPFYTTLCLWVGAIVLNALLSTKAKNIDFACTPWEEFVGKYLLFVSAALLQGLLAALGDIFLLGIEMKDPVLFVQLSMLYSLVFSMIVYVLVSLLRNVGKALAVFLLVIQIGGSGGTFPVEVTPAFFQAIHPFLPFSYGVNGMRQAVFGVTFATLKTDIHMMLIFFVLFALIGFFCKAPANRWLDPFTQKLHQSGIIE